MAKSFVIPKKPEPAKFVLPSAAPKSHPPARVVTSTIIKERPPLKAEVVPYDYHEDGRAQLDRVCQEKGLVWGLLRTNWNTIDGTSYVTTRVVVGSLYENTIEDNRGGHPGGVKTADRPHSMVDDCLLALAKELEGDGT